MEIKTSLTPPNMWLLTNYFLEKSIKKDKLCNKKRFLGQVHFQHTYINIIAKADFFPKAKTRLPQKRYFCKKNKTR